MGVTPDEDKGRISPRKSPQVALRPSHERNYQPHPSPPLEKEGTVKGKIKSIAFILAGFVLPVTVPSLFGEG